MEFRELEKTKLFDLSTSERCAHGATSQEGQDRGGHVVKRETERLRNNTRCEWFQKQSFGLISFPDVELVSQSFKVDTFQEEDAPNDKSVRIKAGCWQRFS